MKRVLIYISCLLFALPPLFSQPTVQRFSKTFEHLYGGGQYNAIYHGIDIIPLSKSYLVSGVFQAGLHPGNSDPSLYSYLSQGVHVEVSFLIDSAGHAFDTIFHPYRVMRGCNTLVDTIAMLYGSRYFNENNQEGFEGVAILVAESGQVLDSLFVREIDEITSAVALTDSGYIFVGQKDPRMNIPSDGLVKMVRVDKHNNIVWSKNYLHNEPGFLGGWFNKAMRDSDALLWDDSTIVIQYAGSRFTSTSSYGYLLVSLDDGTVQFDRVYQSGLQDDDTPLGFTLGRRIDGGLTSIAAHRVPQNPSGSCEHTAPIAGLDLNFTPDWVYINQWFLDNLDNCDAKYQLNDLLVRKDGTIIACGRMIDSLYATDSAGWFQPNPYVRYTPVLVGLDNSGKFLWQKYIDPEVIHQGVLQGIAETHDGGVILVGDRHFYPTGLYTTPWVLKLDSDYCLEPGCKDSSVLNKTINNIEINHLGEVQIGPNPTNGKFKVITSNETFETVDYLILYNMFGQQVLLQTLESEDSVFDISMLPIGAYIARVFTKEDKPFITIKLLHIRP
jgi:Secretion system C-terminal sorting domain